MRQEIDIRIDDVRRCIPDAEGDWLVLVGIVVAVAIDGHGDVWYVIDFLWGCHASAFAVDEGCHATVGTLEKESSKLYLSDDGHLVLIERRIDIPVWFLAAHFHHDTERFENLVVALKAEGQVVIAHTHQWVHTEAESLGGNRCQFTRGLTSNNREPLRQVLQTVVFGEAALILNIHIEGIAVAILLDDIDRILCPLEWILLH